MNGWRKSSYSFANGNCAEVAAWRKSRFSANNGACAEVAAWRKSPASMSNGHCVEAAGNWRKPSRCASNECAEVGQDGTVVGVRDSQDPDGPVLTFSAAAWAAFLAQLNA